MSVATANGSVSCCSLCLRNSPRKSVWISIESAEMVKHGVNAFLATCVTFANELAVICERVGADAAEVERALRLEPRIGPHAYIKPGAAFAGGTLARDIVFLNTIAGREAPATAASRRRDAKQRSTQALAGAAHRGAIRQPRRPDRGRARPRL